MQKLKLVGLKEEDAVILNALTRSGLFEPKSGDAVGGAVLGGDTAQLDSILSKQARCAFAISKLSDSAKEAAKKAKKNPEFAEFANIKLNKRLESGWGDLDESLAGEAELLAVCGEIEQLAFTRAELKSKKSKLTTLMRQVSVYKDCTDKFTAFVETDKCSSVLVSGKFSKSFLPALQECPVYIKEYTEKSYSRVYGIVYLKDNADAVRRIISDHGFTACPYDYDATATEQLTEFHAQLAQYDADDDNALKDILSYAEYSDRLKVLYDALYVDADKTKAKLGYYSTEKTFVLEGWLPSPEAERIVGLIKERTDKIEVFLSDAEAAEKPPTMYKKNGVLEPYQYLTDSYSPPAYGEFDPSPFTAFFFFLFFGMMTGDAGYGLILALGTFLIVKVLKPRAGFKSLVMLIGISSISAIVWGLLFGSVFGLDFNVLGGVFGLDLPGSIWFNPLDADSGGPMMLLVLSLAFGIVHMITGYAIDMYKKIKDGKIMDAVCDSGFMIITYIGVMMLLFWMSIDMLNVTLLPSWLSNLLMPGLIIFATGLALMIVTRGRKKKGVAGKIVSGVGGLYEIVNILSDTLSYSRVFGLTLASCAIGYAFNELVSLVAGAGPIGIIFAIVLALVLHVFNMAMGVLSAYVHNARLQYLEFYGKFYDGGGRSFAPLGSKTKYTVILPSDVK